MNPIETEVVVILNDKWFMEQFEKIIKRYIRSEVKRSLALADLRRVVWKAGESLS